MRTMGTGYILNKEHKAFFTEVMNIFRNGTLEWYVLYFLSRNGGTSSYSQIFNSENMPPEFVGIKKSNISRTIANLEKFGIQRYRSGNEVFLSLDYSQEAFLNNVFNALEMYMLESCKNSLNNRVSVEHWIKNKAVKKVEVREIEDGEENLQDGPGE